MVFIFLFPAKDTKGLTVYLSQMYADKGADQLSFFNVFNHP